MSGTISLITPSYRGDLARSALLFESVDRHARAFEKHYVIVHDEDLGLFAPFNRGRRQVMPVSRFLPGWLHAMPSFIRPRGRLYWWSLKAWPIRGWHTQQIVKIQAVATLPEERYCLIDSDNCFFRPFDVAALASPNPVPLYGDPGAVQADRPLHAPWLKAAHRLLGLPEPRFPADDHIGQIIVWDQATIRAMTARIEAVTGRGWVEALCREYEFSEYLIYGAFVTNDARRLAATAPTSRSLCRAYWDGETLDEAGLLALLRGSAPDQVAVCVQSFGATPLAAIRASIRAFEAEAEAAAPAPPQRNAAR
ncbi:DUF6492 family protein [Labrys wisconsinensis]|uniref:Uncharacterized protein n=1 Tax=Labrys wisconsinensis TaxID=425677 RepID=A0ABU0IZ40_9HYPH|nr:DUF6492 family protein [Labrys wisconsinensis]MDQ0467277.1 hypothetical protein [Labrys wisconsinensis]